MSNNPSQSSLFRRWWKPAAASGAGGTAIVVRFEEMLFFAQEIVTLISIAILAGVIYLLDIFMFKSRMPKKEK